MADTEKSKGVSLRKKKDKSSRRQNQIINITGPLDAPRPPSSTGSTATKASSLLKLPGVHERLKPGGATSDIIKKRYSIRYAQTPDFGAGAPAIPGLPSIPQQFAQPAIKEESTKTAASQGVDVKALRDPTLAAEDYVTNILSGATEADIQEYQQKLKSVQNRASTDLQHNVYQNRTQFIKISKEAEKLKDEMRTLRGLMTDLSSTLGAASLSSGSAAPTDNGGSRRPSFSYDSETPQAASARKRANRSSVANLEALWNTQLQALWKNIEGSQKFLPAIPGRHVVLESGHWIELDAATWKSRRPVHMVLLNDHLLVATKKSKRLEPSSSALSPEQRTPTKLVAVRCWPLQEIELVEPDSSRINRNVKEITNAITVRYGPESFTYRSDRAADAEKTGLMAAFKRTMDELRRAEKTAVDESTKANGAVNGNEKSLNYLASIHPAITARPGIVRGLSKKERPAEIMVDVDGKQRNLRWVEGQVDELDIDVALQRFEDAVGRVEMLRRVVKGLKGNGTVQEVVGMKVDERAKKLADQLTHLLTLSHPSLTPTLLHTSHLTRLNLSPLARATYLAARTSYLVALTRSIPFTGSLPQYIAQLSYITFTVLKNTITTYSQCFPETPKMGGLAVWAKERLDVFLESVQAQMEGVGFVSGGEDGGVGASARRECVGIVREFAEGVGGEVGFEFEALVRRALGGEGRAEGGGGGAR